MAFTKAGRCCFPLFLLALPLGNGCRARKLHSPIFWLLLMKARSINECVSHCPSATWLWEAQEAQGFLEVLAVWGE